MKCKGLHTVPLDLAVGQLVVRPVAYKSTCLAAQKRKVTLVPTCPLSNPKVSTSCMRRWLAGWLAGWLAWVSTTQFSQTC